MSGESTGRRLAWSCLLGSLVLVGCTPPQPAEPVAPAPPTLPQAGSDGATGTPTEAASPSAAGEDGRSRQRTLAQGHSATVNCLHGERGQTDGNELRCEDWSYVRQNYLQAP